MTIVWADLETTGLDASKHAVLEVAVIITDDNLVEIARFHRVVHWSPPSRFPEDADVDPFCVDTHMNNGLWTESAKSHNHRDAVDRELAKFIITHVEAVGKKTGPQLGGSTISFDRAFLESRLPEAHATLHYRNIDVTSMNEFARRFWPEVHAARPPAGHAHRAMVDCEESLSIARYYATALGPR